MCSRKPTAEWFGPTQHCDENSFLGELCRLKIQNQHHCISFCHKPFTLQPLRLWVAWQRFLGWISAHLHVCADRSTTHYEFCMEVAGKVPKLRQLVDIKNFGHSLVKRATIRCIEIRVVSSSYFIIPWPRLQNFLAIKVFFFLFRISHTQHILDIQACTVEN